MDQGANRVHPVLASYLSSNRRLPEPVKARFRHPERVQPFAAAYASVIWPLY